MLQGMIGIIIYLGSSDDRRPVIRVMSSKVISRAMVADPGSNTILFLSIAELIYFIAC